MFGCGGDRDRGKRPLMTSAALNGADIVVLTSDNPRTEDPEQIIADALEGIVPDDCQRVQVIVDRAEAIRSAITSASVGDIIVIAGKGHENYQEIQGVRCFLTMRSRCGQCWIFNTTALNPRFIGREGRYD